MFYAQSGGKIIRCGTADYYQKLFQADVSLKARFDANQRNIISRNINPQALRILELSDTITLAIHVIGNAALHAKVTNAVIQSQIDVLNEVAFMCMDLEYFGRPDLSQLFFEKYNLLFPTVLTKEDEELFLLYKAYRANVCAKVNSLKAQSAFDPGHKQNYIKKGSRYLVAMNKYLDRVQRSVLGAVHTEMLFT